MPTLLAFQEFLEGGRGGHPFLELLLEALDRAGRQARAVACLDGEPGYCSSMETPPPAAAPGRSGLMSAGVVEKRLGAARVDGFLHRLSMLLIFLLMAWQLNALSCRNGWKPKQGVLEGNSSMHLFSSALLKEISTLEHGPIPISGDSVGTKLRPQGGVMGESLLRSGPWKELGLWGIKLHYLE